MSNLDLPLEVSIDYPLYESKQGHYFIGETPSINGQTGTSFASLTNPCNSDHALFVNAITITNISDVTLAAEFYLGVNPGTGLVSNFVRCTNTLLYPVPLPTGCILYSEASTFSSTNGIAIFTRMVPPESTLVVDGGQMILGQGHSLIVSIGGLTLIPFDQIRFAFGWWEKALTPCM